LSIVFSAYLGQFAQHLDSRASAAIVG